MESSSVEIDDAVGDAGFSGGPYEGSQHLYAGTYPLSTEATLLVTGTPPSSMCPALSGLRHQRVALKL